MDIVDYLKENGACYSPNLIRLLAESGISDDTARKRISRAVQNKQIRRLHGITFPKKASFLYLESTFNTPEFWDELIKVLDEFCPAYSAAIHALRSQGGFIRSSQFSIVSGSPIKQSGQISAQAVKERLKAIDIIQEHDYIELGECISFNTGVNISEVNTKEFKARNLAENILITAVKDWARKVNMVSYNSVEYRRQNSALPRVGTFNWDIAGPSFLRPFFRTSKDGKRTGGFFVCDVMVDAVLDEKSIQAYLRKCKLTSYLKNLSPVLFCLVARGFTPEAFTAAKGDGVLACTIENLFGKDIAEGLTSLIRTLTRLGEMAAARPEIIDELFHKLGAIEGAAANIRGAMFELLVGHCVKAMDDGSIDIGEIINDSETSRRYEVDILRVKKNREVWVYECKAHQATEIVKLEDVDFWFKQRVAPIYKIMHKEQRFRESEFHFEYWTCGTFAPGAKAYLDDISEKTRRYKIGYKDGEAVREYIQKVRPSALLKMFNEHFYKHPISRAEKLHVRQIAETAKTVPPPNIADSQ